MASLVTQNLRLRRNFGKIRRVLDVPKLIEIQRQSYDKFLQADLSQEKRADTGLQGVFRSVFPIRDFSGSAELEFDSYVIGEPKYDVELCRWRNGRDETAVIPERVLVKEPSAELKEGQKDTDTLPPYEVLDPILKAYVEQDKSFEEILSLGCEAEGVERVVRMIDRSEYKRRQPPPGIKITERAFGRDRRFPITNQYRSY